MNEDNLGDELVVVRDLRKRRGKQQALDGASFAIRRGRVFGLIGPNGAGKTTTIKILLGLLAPDSGSATVFGKAPMDLPPADRQRIGYLSEASERLPDLPVAELLEYHSHFFSEWDWGWCRSLIERMQVPTTQNLYGMSEGERRKTELLLALAHRPALLILDDPALGLDARARRDILWATVASARDDGTTVLFTSHILQDVERVVDDVLVLDRGKVRIAGTLDDVLSRTKRLVFPDADALDPLPGELQRTQHGRDLVVTTSGFTEPVLAGLRRHHPLVRVEDLNLEEIFCTLVDTPKAESAENAAS
jgi:ABC-type multidrug transport system ATPase subunit